MTAAVAKELGEGVAVSGVGGEGDDLLGEGDREKDERDGDGDDEELRGFLSHLLQEPGVLGAQGVCVLHLGDMASHLDGERRDVDDVDCGDGEDDDRVEQERSQDLEDSREEKLRFLQEAEA